ncbi:MAG: hypothetical protein JWM59_270 [Verrucomicrobiales bacterium]|nr:hypothetical protein [Verrucomicrobiales bacterium]
MDIIRNPDGSLSFRTTVEVTVPAGTSMLEAEELLMKEINGAGASLTGKILESRDGGEPFVREGRRFTAKSKKEVRHVETPFGCVVVRRHAFQSSLGGVCHYPMDEAGCLTGAATPKFARMISRKMVELPAAEVVRDLRENHTRAVTVDFVQRLTGLVGVLAQSVIPAAGAGTLPAPEEVASVSIGVDGACVHMSMPARPQAADRTAADGRKGRTREWRVGMVGAITLYDKTGERLGTIYAATAPPEDKSQGKAAFWSIMEKEAAAVQARYPAAIYTGLSDGASDLLPWLRERTTRQVLDFYHACGYLHAAVGAFTHEAPAGEDPGWWSHEACRHLKEDEGTAAALLTEMERRLASTRRLGAADRTALEKAVTYFGNNVERMDYAACAAAGLPIGSGVTEAGCKLLVKKRLCGPGMTWGFTMAGHILRLRALAHSAGGRWASPWKAILT